MLQEICKIIGKYFGKSFILINASESLSKISLFPIEFVVFSVIEFCHAKISYTFSYKRRQNVCFNF